MSRITDDPASTYVSGEALASHRASGHKQVCNDRLRAELGITLRYPSYREGLAAIRRETE